MSHFTNLKSSASSSAVVFLQSTSVQIAPGLNLTDNNVDDGMNAAVGKFRTSYSHLLRDEKSAVMKYPPSGMMGFRPTLARHEASLSRL